METQDENCAAPAEPHPIRVGVIFVHGIGEQRRFEFLDAQIRHILRGIKRNAQVSVEIAAAPAAAFHAEQDTWAAAAPVRAHVRKAGVDDVEVTFHEVWWADVNEPYSVAKQIRFWFWGLAVWAYPQAGTHQLAGNPGRRARISRPPIAGAHSVFFQPWIRVRLFLVGVFFLLGGLTIGLLTVIAERLLRFRPPDLLQTLTNIVSGVKLYNQRQRFGTGFAIWPETQDFLDTLDEPPRVSVRRRMIRAIADVAEQEYDRWYIIAHSLGTVVAFNGLMELPEAWPGYFDKSRWDQFCRKGFAGSAREDYDVTADMPQRPVWADRDVADRPLIFSRFRGLLTLGSPLAKFAAIWPARAPIANLRAFKPNTLWLNVYDPLDPVSGPLREFSKQDLECCPHPSAIGYRAHWVLLLSHLHYLTFDRKHSCLADGVARWLIEDRPDGILKNDWTCSTDLPWWRSGLSFRTLSAWVQWFATGVVLSFISAGAIHLATGKLLHITFQVPDFFGSLFCPYTLAILLSAAGTVGFFGAGPALTRAARRMRDLTAGEVHHRTPSGK